MTQDDSKPSVVVAVAFGLVIAFAAIGAWHYGAAIRGERPWIGAVSPEPIASGDTLGPNRFETEATTAPPALMLLTDRDVLFVKGKRIGVFPGLYKDAANNPLLRCVE